jgi:YidC/Oxa1 family membrane protein insertase
MESQRLILFFIFSFSLFLLFDAWQRDQSPQPASTSAAAPAKQDSGMPPAPSEKLIPTPAAPAPGAAPAPAAGLAAGATIAVETDVYRAEISAVGGDLRRLELIAHRAVDDKKKTFVLFDQRSDHVYVAQSGLIGSDLPTHRTAYTAQQTAYKLAEGSKGAAATASIPRSRSRTRDRRRYSPTGISSSCATTKRPPGTP